MSGNIFRVILKVSLETNGIPDTQFDHASFYNDGKKFIAITSDGSVYDGDVNSRTIKKVHNLQRRCTALLIFEEDAQFISLFGLDNGSIVKFNIDLKSEVGSHEGIGEAANYLSRHSGDDKLLATVNYSAILWDLSKSMLLPIQHLSTTNTVKIKKAFFGPQGNNIFTCFVDGNIFTWEFPSLKFQYQLETKSLDLSSIAVAEDKTTMLTLNQKLEFSLWDLTVLERRQTFSVPEIDEKVEEIGITTLTNHRSNENVSAAVVLSLTGNLYFIDLQKYVLIYKYKVQNSVKLVKFKSATTYNREINLHPFACVLSDGSLEIWDIRRLYKKVTTDSAVAQTKASEDQVERIEIIPKKSTPKVKVSKTEAKMKLIELEELRKTLEDFGEFPSKYRAVIWRHVLQLPLNRQAFVMLINRGLHPTFSNLEERFPVIDQNLLTTLKKILSAFAYWCPLFAEVSYFPLMIFPFVRILHENILVCFEVIMTFLVNWCHDWFRIYPAPPFHSMARVEEYLEKFAPDLLAHFVKYNVSMRIYAWPLLESSFSDVFTADEWCRVWDHIFTSQDNDFLYATAAAYSIVSRNSLLACTQTVEFQRYYSEKNPVPIDSILQECKNMIQGIPAAKKRRFIRLTEHTYPLFSDFPLAVIENHAQHMQKIRGLEADYLKQKKETAMLEAEFGYLHEMDSEWRRKEAMLKAVEDLRQQEMVIEEKKLLEQRTRLQLQRKHLLEQEMRLLESKKRGLQREYIQRRKDDIVRMKDNTRWMAILRQTELMDADHEADVRNYQMQMDKCLYEIRLLENEIANKNKPSESGGSIDSNSLLTNSETSDERRQIKETGISSSKSETLDDKLKRLEASNKEMEDEIKSLVQSLNILS